MTIDESMKVLQEVPKVMPITKESINVALETMHKYQKIVGIVSLNDEEFKQCGLKELKEILEVIADGTINSSSCI